MHSVSDVFGNAVETTVINSSEKKFFMRGSDELHYLYWNRLGIELTSYESVDIQSDSVIQNIKTEILEYLRNPYSVRIRLKCAHRILLRVNGAKSQKVNFGYIIRGVGPLPNVRFDSSIVQKNQVMKGYLDEIGLVSVAFYVDQPLKFSMQHRINFLPKISKPFDVSIPHGIFCIQFVKIGGLTFEFISKR